MQQVDEFIGKQFETSTGSVVTVVGVSGRKTKGGHKLYLCECSVCSLDKELFPDLFEIPKSELKKRGISCGCSKKPSWTREQYRLRCKREAEKRGLGFNGFSGEWKGNQTKLKLVCEKHGEWETANISGFFCGRGCYSCGRDKVKKAKTKPDQKMVDSFVSSGAFKEGTKFWRSNKKTKQGTCVYWHYSCPVCSTDEYVKAGLCSGVFENTSNNLQKGKLSCRCARSHMLTPEQYALKCKTEADKMGHVFNGFLGNWNGNKTKLNLTCKEHGDWYTTTIANLFNGHSCPTCAADKTKERSLKPDQEMINAFMSSGAFKEGTKFWRSERKDKLGRSIYWYCSCPVCSDDEYVKAGLCSGVFEISTSNLRSGKQPCRCASSFRWTQDQREYQLKKEMDKEGSQFVGWVSKYTNSNSKFNWICKEGHECDSIVANFLNSKTRCPLCAGHAQQQGYINTISDGDTLIGLKFGIARDSSTRVRKQNSKSIFTISPLKTYNNPSVEACKAAESEVKHTLRCGVFTQSEVSDGYTETCHLIDLENVMSIFSKHGGKQEITCNT